MISRALYRTGKGPGHLLPAFLRPRASLFEVTDGPVTVMSKVLYRMGQGPGHLVPAFLCLRASLFEATDGVCIQWIRTLWACNQNLLEHLLSYPDLLDLRHFSTRIFHSTALQ